MKFKGIVDSYHDWGGPIFFVRLSLYDVFISGKGKKRTSFTGKSLYQPNELTKEKNRGKNSRDTPF